MNNDDMYNKIRIKNTVHAFWAVDCEAFLELLEKGSDKWEISKALPEKAHNKQHIKAVYSRYTMDTHGYHIGYEHYHIKWKTFNKSDFPITGIPQSRFPYMIFPYNFDIVKIVGAARQSSVYYKADEDFVYQEIEFWLDMDLPELSEAEFDPVMMTWNI